MTALPDIIIQNGLFCCWKYEERNGRKTKVPYQPEAGLGAKSNDPSSFVPYKTAVQASGYDGIGIGIFNGICAIDLDNCVSDSGYYTQTAAEIVALLHSYTEYSPSGNGLHIQSVRCCHTKILQEVSYGILPIDQLLEDDFLCTVADVVHGSDPCHLILRFQLLIDTFFLGQLCYEQMKFVACLGVNISQIAVQSSAENKIGIEHRAIFF